MGRGVCRQVLEPESSALDLHGEGRGQILSSCPLASMSAPWLTPSQEIILFKNYCCFSLFVTGSHTDQTGLKVAI